jgi:Zn-dependent protease with chaperone function
MSERFSLWLLRRTLGINPHRLDSHIYCAWEIPSIAMSFGGLVILSAKFVIESSPDELRAVIEHEQAHRLLHRRRWHLTLLRTLAPAYFTSISHRQEYEADAYVARLGLAEALISALLRHTRNSAAGVTHPSVESRIARLQHLAVASSAALDKK